MTPESVVPVSVPVGGAIRRLWWGIGLLLIALLAWGARGLLSSGQHHSWDSAAVPPTYVALTKGHTYTLSTAGGIAALAARQGSEQPSLQCTATASDGTALQLTIQTQSVDHRVLHVIGQFTAANSERVQISCEGTGPVFVDDADDAQFDRAGAVTLVLTIAAVLGVALAISGAYGYASATARRSVGPSASAPPESGVDIF